MFYGTLYLLGDYLFIYFGNQTRQQVTIIQTIFTQKYLHVTDPTSVNGPV